MSSISQPNYEYQDGGTLPPDSPTYVKRQADEYFYQALKEGKFCYVLNSRQMGKSSLRVRTMQRLQSEGFYCAAIDVSINTNVSQEQWYADLIYSLVNQLNLYDCFDLDSWWSSNILLSPMQRLRRFMEEILFKNIGNNTVIFIDEIDSIISLKFKIDDFFAFIRYCYNQRADKPEYKRLTFSLLGVATPSDLIKDKTRTPFNIGQAIELNGFQINEVSPLAQGLAGKVDNPLEVLKQILDWTGGQPYLTHRLCKLVNELQLNITAGSEAEFIKQLVRTRIIDDWEYQDKQAHLQTIRNRILESDRAGRLLGLYHQILEDGEVAPNDSPEEMELRLSGLVVEQQSTLKVYNRIYQCVFDKIWLTKELAKLRPYAEAINAWLASGSKDNSRLLRGKALDDAQKWAIGKSLSNDDYQFLQASQAEAWKSMRFRFKNGEAANILELITLCDKYPQEAEEYLFNNYLENWLVAHLGRTDLANISSNIIGSFKTEKRKGLEKFVRELCQSVEIEAFPKFIVEPDKLDFGQVPVGYKQILSLNIHNNRRGFAWGEVNLEGNIPGVSISTSSKSFNSLLNQTIDIQLDTLNVPLGNYKGSITIQLEGIDNDYRVLVDYQVTNLKVYIEPSQLDLGIIKGNIASLENVVKITCEPSFGRIKGYAQIGLQHISLEPYRFETSCFYLSLIIDAKLTLSGFHKDEIVLKTNAGEYKIPISLTIPVRWENIFGYSLLSSIFSAIVMYITRLVISNYSAITNINLTNFCYLKSQKNTLLNLITNINNHSQIIAVFGFVTLLALLFIKVKSSRFSGDFFHSLNNLITHVLIISTIIALVFLVFNIKFIFSEGPIFNALNMIGFSVLMIIDLIVSPFTWLGLKEASYGWLMIGLIAGALFGIAPTLNRSKRDNIYLLIAAISIGLIMVLAGYLTIFFLPYKC